MSKIKCLTCNKILKENELIWDMEEKMNFCPKCGEGSKYFEVAIKQESDKLVDLFK